MNRVKKAVAIIKESNYFEEWDEVLLQQTAINQWSAILKLRDANEILLTLGKDLYYKKIPYVIVTEYIDEFFRYYEGSSLVIKKRYQIKNAISKAYLHERLFHDSQSIQQELNKKLPTSIEKKRYLINAHLNWMHSFIHLILDETGEVQFDYNLCQVGQWMNHTAKDYLDPIIYTTHKNLHIMAESSLRMYKRQDYAHFLLSYLDILTSSYKIKDYISHVYLTKQLVSIYQDPLSKHANYFQLKEDIKETSNKMSLLMMNIKEFSKINLLYGHSIGDDILKEVINILDKSPLTDKVYRIYGDEFTVLFATTDRNKKINQLQQKLEGHPFKIKDSTIRISFYYSVATVNKNVLALCEYGLMLSKSQHKKLIDVDKIDKKDLKEHSNNITLNQKLRLAFLDNRIEPFFQPIMENSTGKIVKYEALMRVIDLNGDILFPADFLKVLYNMYIYPEVTKSIIQKTFQKFNDNQYEFSINLSLQDITDVDTENFIIAMLKKFPDAAKCCTFELLEDESFENHEEVKKFLDILHQYGVKIALDDFGSGYANYDTIFNLDIDYIKIDGSLTQSILENPKSLILMESIISVAKELNVKVIVEFVSSNELYKTIKSMGVDYLQGYYIGKPMQNLTIN